MRSTAKVALAASLVVSSMATQASIITEDLFTTNDGLLTLDTNTNLGWLDWTYTTNLSYETVLNRINDVNDSLYGFKYASVYDFQTLLSSFNASTHSSSSTFTGISPTNDPVPLFNSLGYTSFSTDYKSGLAITKTYRRSNTKKVIKYSYNRSDDKYQVLLDSSNGMFLDARKDYVGHALYIDMTPVNPPEQVVNNTGATDPSTAVTEVSEPSVFAMLFAGIALLFTRRKSESK
ncbi:hypothetical protein J1N51_09935 [Psychrosphaera ytuae]|uniref:PEP-CTERM protein-sorting domain-containing protein n=1 Tax=Psychrosphaera ytuae TaxID=2820710 RepID=A0A975D9L2_9GAMM|nr:hypothetical protein [Psychrosphaera ytuae]QTH63062.1 hypothetical protein J1N51_09935 [Psychrosphaera ytuae]